MKEQDYTRNILSTIRTLNEESENRRRMKSLLREEEHDKDDAIAITDSPRFGENVLQNQIDSFKQIVCNGAKFAKPIDKGGGKATDNPLVYFPKTGNLVFSGSIPVYGIKWQFSLNDASGSPYIWTDGGVALSSEVLNVLQKMRGYYQNFRDQWLESSDLLDKLGKGDDE